MRPQVERTLLIDDSDIDLFIQRRFLEVCHFSTDLQVYKSAEEALTWLKGAATTELPDIIFLDLNMPEFDGFAFLRHFRDMPEAVKQRARIVVLTSSNSSKDREQAFSFPNVIHFITKPLKQSDIEALAKMITN